MLLIEQQCQHTIHPFSSLYEHFNFNRHILSDNIFSTLPYQYFIERLLEPIHMLGDPVAIYYKRSNHLFT